MKAVTFAGGRGTRISEESQDRPKPMVDIGGRPILWHISPFEGDPVRDGDRVRFTEKPRERPTRVLKSESEWTVLHDFGFLYGGAERVTHDIYDAIRPTNPLRYIAGNEEVLK